MPSGNRQIDTVYLISNSVFCGKCEQMDTRLWFMERNLSNELLGVWTFISMYNVTESFFFHQSYRQLCM